MQKFDTIPVLRGFTEIKFLFEAAEKFDAVIAGGYVRYMCSPDNDTAKAGDVDIFPKSEDVTYKLVEFLEHNEFRVKHHNEVAYTLKYEGSDTRLKAMPDPQVIKPIRDGRVVTVGSLEEILNNFDFTVVRVGLVTPESALADKDFSRDEDQKVLKIRNIHCPISTMIRALKYGRKGYYSGPVEAVKLFRDWDNRDTGYKRNVITLLESIVETSITEEDKKLLYRLLRVD